MPARVGISSTMTSNVCFSCVSFFFSRKSGTSWSFLPLKTPMSM